MAQTILPPFVSSISAWWDFTDYASLTISGGLISTCNDQSGNGKHLTSSGGNRFAVQNRNGRYVGYASGVEQGMSNAAMSINQRSFTVVLAFQPAASSRQMGNSGAQVPWHIPSQFLYGDTEGKWIGVHGGSTRVNTPDTYISDSPTLITWSMGASTSKLRIDDGAIQSGAPMDAATATTMYLGNFSNLALGVPGDFLGCIVYNRQLTDAEMETVRRFCAAYWGCGVSKTHEIICDGDSNMIGGFSSGNNDVAGVIYNPASQLARLRPSWRVYNFAVGGVTTATNITNLATQGALVAANTQMALPTIGVLSNGNDFSDSTTAQAMARFATYTTTLAATKQVYCTVPNRVTTGFNVWAAALAVLQQGTYSFVADLRAIPELADITNTAYYSLDQIHRDENGYALEANVIAATIDAAIAASSTTLDAIYAQARIAAQNTQA